MAVCPVDCFYRTEDGVVLHDKDLCIGCGYCFYACPFGAPQFPQAGAFGVRGKMDKCTFCAGGPEPNNSEAEYKKYGRNRLAEGKLPVCAEMCSTKAALIGGDGDVLAEGVYRTRVTTRGKGSEVWGWGTAYGRSPTRRRVHPVAPPARHHLPWRPRAEPNRDPARSPGDGLLAAVALSVAGCGERPQVIQYKQGKYQGKARTNGRLTTVRHGTGTSASGSSRLRSRNQNQNEYNRIYSTCAKGEG